MGVFGLLVHRSLARNPSLGTAGLFPGSQQAFVWLLALLSLARTSSCLVCCAKGIESPHPPGTTLAEKELFTGDELSMLFMNAHKYRNKLAKGPCLEVHKRMMMVRDFRARAQKLMVLFVTDVKRAFKAKRALQAKRRVIKKQLSVKLGLWPKKY